MLRLVRTALTGALIAAGLTLAPPPLNPLPIASAEAAALSAEDRADVARVEAYLNGITSMKSSFLQSSSTGHVARGTVWLRRPGRIDRKSTRLTPVTNAHLVCRLLLA